MNKLDVNALGVVELDQAAMLEVDGGNMFLVAFLIGFAIGYIEEKSCGQLII